MNATNPNNFNKANNHLLISIKFLPAYSSTFTGAPSKEGWQGLVNIDESPITVSASPTTLIETNVWPLCQTDIFLH